MHTTPDRVVRTVAVAAVPLQDGHTDRKPLFRNMSSRGAYMSTEATSRDTLTVLLEAELTAPVAGPTYCEYGHLQPCDNRLAHGRKITPRWVTRC